MLKDTVITASVTVTSDSQTTGVAVDISGSYIGQAVVKVTACDATTGDETYFAYLEVRDGTNWYRVGGVSIPRGVTGEYSIPFAGKTVSKMAIAGAIDQVRLNIDVGGTSPSITAEAYLSKV